MRRFRFYDNENARRDGETPDARGRFYRERLSRYLDGELDPSSAAMVAAALREDAELRAHRDALEAERRELIESMVEAPALSSGFAARVMARVAKESFDPGVSDGEEAALQSPPIDAATLARPSAGAALRRAPALRRVRFLAGVAAGIVVGAALTLLGPRGVTPTPDPVVDPVLARAGSDVVASPSREAVTRNDAADVPVGRLALATESRPAAEDDRLGPPIPETWELGKMEGGTLAEAEYELGQEPETTDLALAVERVSDFLGAEESPCTSDANQDRTTDARDLAWVVVRQLAAAQSPVSVRHEIDCASLAVCEPLYEG